MTSLNSKCDSKSVTSHTTRLLKYYVRRILFTCGSYQCFRPPICSTRIQEYVHLPLTQATVLIKDTTGFPIYVCIYLHIYLCVYVRLSLYQSTRQAPSSERSLSQYLILPTLFLSLEKGGNWTESSDLSQEFMSDPL